jgi:hypothetical protein
MSITLLSTVSRSGNPHYISKYVSFITKRLNNQKIKYVTHHHHILPKAQDFFPQYKCLKTHPWNGVHLSPREHFIAHRMLHKAFPGSTQSIAFFNMANICGRTNSRAYDEARSYQIAAAKITTQCPIRNAKISAALKGKPKSQDHINSMIGHAVTETTREKLRQANLGKKMSETARRNIIASRKGKKRGPYSESGRAAIAEAARARKNRWYNNGIENRSFVTPPDESWVPGIVNSHIIGRKWFNNGIENKMLKEPIDDTWLPGRLPFK